MKLFREWFPGFFQTRRILIISIAAGFLLFGVVGYYLVAPALNQRQAENSRKSQPLPKKRQETSPVTVPEWPEKWPEPVRRDSTEQEAQVALETARAFAEDTELSLVVQHVEERAEGRVCRLESYDVSVEVDLENQRVSMFLLHPQGGEAPDGASVSLTQARKKAKKYALKHFEGFAQLDMQLTESRRIDHGAASSEYRFAWHDRKSPSYVDIGVNAATGRVISYAALHRKGDVNSKPTIAKKKATEIAKKAVDFDVTEVGQVDLRIWYHPVNSPTARQVLFWEVRLEGAPVGLVDQGAAVQIDAHTGKVLAILHH